MNTRNLESNDVIKTLVPDANEVVGKTLYNWCRFRRLQWRFINCHKNCLLCLHDNNTVRL